MSRILAGPLLPPRCQRIHLPNVRLSIVGQMISRRMIIKYTTVTKRFISVKAIAEYLDLKVDTIYAWVYQKKIPYVKIGRCVKFDLQEIEDWLNKKKAEKRPTNIAIIVIFRIVLVSPRPINRFPRLKLPKPTKR